MIKKYLLTWKNRLSPERKFRVPRIWSNKELLRVSSLFTGDIINVSGASDIDKVGGKYREYFYNAQSYSISNYASEFRGFEGKDGEILLDLEQTLPHELTGKWDVVFNHTTLEHVFDVTTAFKNLCLMSKDVVIVVVPWLQELHYGEGFKDYWRISPFSIEKLFQKNGLELVHLQANNNKKESVYILAIGSKNPNKWKNHKELNVDRMVFSNLGNYIIGKRSKQPNI